MTSAGAWLQGCASIGPDPKLDSLPGKVEAAYCRKINNEGGICGHKINFKWIASGDVMGR